MKRHAATVILCALAVIGAALLWWDRRHVTTDEAAGRTLQLFDAWREGDITAVTVETPKSAIRLTRVVGSQDASWRVKTGTHEAPADEQSVEDFLLSLEYASFERRAAIDAAAAGLLAPELTATIAMGALRYTLRVGGPAPSPPAARYAQVDGGARGTALYVIKAELVKSLLEEPRALRDKKLVPYLSSEVARYELSGAQSWVLQRGAAGGRATTDMMLSAPDLPDQRASFRAVDAWVTLLSRLSALRFLDGDEAGSGAMNSASPAGEQGAATDLRIKVVPRDEHKPAARIAIGGRCEGGTLVRVTAPEPVLACADKAVVAALIVPASRFVDRFALGMPETDVTEIKLWDETATVELARRGEGWHLRKPTEGQIDAAIGNALLERIAKVEGDPVDAAADGRPISLKELGLDPPRAHARFIGLPERGAGPDAKEHVEEIEVGAEDKGEVVVRRVGDGRSVRVPAASAAALLPAPSALRPPKIVDLALKDVRALDLDCDGKRQKLTRDDKGVWTLVEPQAAGLGADMGAGNELADQLRLLTAVRWDAEKSEPRHGLDAPWCSIAMTAAEGDEGAKKERTLKLLLGAETGGGYFARQDGDAAVFVAPRLIASLARQWLLDRGALLIDPASVERVEITSGGKKLAIARRGDAWTLADSPGDSRAQEIGRALTTLVADGVPSVGAAQKDEGFDAPRARIVVERRQGEARIEIAIGAAGLWHDARVFYARKKGLQATFAVSEARIEPILDAL